MSMSTKRGLWDLGGGFSCTVCHCSFMTVFNLVWFCLPNVGERSGALKVNLGFWLVAG